MDRGELIEAYWKQHALATSRERADRLEAEKWFWAWEELDRATDEAVEDVVELLVDLAEAAPDANALGYLGAGPIEDLIHRHAELFVDRIDAAARRSEKFRSALRGVWYDEDVPAAVVERLRRFGSPP